MIEYSPAKTDEYPSDIVPLDQSKSCSFRVRVRVISSYSEKVHLNYNCKNFMKEYTEVLTFFHEYPVFEVENVWKLSQLDSLLQVALCQYFNIVIDRTKFFLFYCQRWKWSCHSFRWCLCSCGFSPLQENACRTEGIDWGMEKWPHCSR